MLPHSRKGSAGIVQEQDIIDSFYEERKSRASTAKHHNLLRKNISYFQQDQTPDVMVESKVGGSKMQLKAVGPQVGGGSTNNTPVASVAGERKFSLSSHADQIFSSLKNIRNKAALSQASLGQASRGRHLEDSGLVSVENKGCRQELQESELLYREHLKEEMNKRINIQNYLSEIGNELRDSGSNFNSMRSDSEAKVGYQNQLKSTHFQIYNNEKDSPEQFYSGVEEQRLTKHKNKPFPPMNSHNRSVDSNHIKDSRKRKNDAKREQDSNKRESLQNKENQIVNKRSQKELKGEKIRLQNNHNSQSSLCMDEDNCFQFSKNRMTDRTQIPRNPFGSEKSNSYHQVSVLSNDSFKRSSGSSKKKSREECLNRLNSEELAELQTNSHPLRQGMAEGGVEGRLKFNYFDPEQEAHYKRRVQDLQRQVQELRGKGRREQKFIQSIAKMRRVMEGLGEGEECSLKELWRWIKHLPGKR